ncbi:hypothetical protein C7S13_4693 [Burkholderia cepacia]|nr:hypothetical protein [Burkholderia cepacia]
MSQIKSCRASVNTIEHMPEITPLSDARCIIAGRRSEAS